MSIIKAKWLYRLESTDPENGLWYNSRGEYHWGIGETDGETKSLPMDYDERYRKDGLMWFSSCTNAEDLAHWFSLVDAKKLIAQGFVFTRYLAVDYNEYNLETCFRKDTALKREIINIEDIWKGEK